MVVEIYGDCEKQEYSLKEHVKSYAKATTTTSHHRQVEHWVGNPLPHLKVTTWDTLWDLSFPHSLLHRWFWEPIHSRLDVLLSSNGCRMLLGRSEPISKYFREFFTQHEGRSLKNHKFVINEVLYIPANCPDENSEVDIVGFHVLEYRKNVIRKSLHG
jgi:hypothetical protein